MNPLSPLAAVGRSVLALLQQIGQVSLFAANTLSHLVRPPFYPREFLSALFQIGWLSLPVVSSLGTVGTHHEYAQAAD